MGDLAACRFCDDETFATWPDALDHAIMNHSREIAKKHPMTGVDVIEPAEHQSNGGRVPR